MSDLLPDWLSVIVAVLVILATIGVVALTLMIRKDGYNDKS